MKLLRRAKAEEVAVEVGGLEEVVGCEEDVEGRLPRGLTIVKLLRRSQAGLAAAEVGGSGWEEVVDCEGMEEGQLR